MTSRVVGLTGGIATGKSTVARFLSDRAAIVDADRLAREVVEPGRPAWEDIVTAFGKEVLAEDGTLDRGKLRKIVFADPRSRRRLEGITHPRIRELAQRRIRDAALGSSFVIYDAPLLFENKIDLWLRPVILVACEPGVQHERLQQRDHLTEDEIQKHLGSQMPMERKRALTDFVIDNNGDLEALEAAVDRVWARLSVISPARYIFPLRDPRESDRRPG